MTVPNTTRRVTFPGDDGTVTFPYSWKIFDQGHLVVTLIDAAGVSTVQTISTHYTVTGVGVPSGGNVVMITPPATGETLVIERVVPLTQSTDLRNTGNFIPQTLEDAFDYMTMALQQMSAGLDPAWEIQEFTMATRPAASESWWKRTIVVKDTGVPELRQVCVVDANGTSYRWETVATGGF